MEQAIADAIADAGRVWPGVAITSTSRPPTARFPPAADGRIASRPGELRAQIVDRLEARLDLGRGGADGGRHAQLLPEIGLGAQMIGMDMGLQQSVDGDPTLAHIFEQGIGEARGGMA
jgi:hypothetical protein